MKLILQVKTFDNVTSDPEGDCNEFLKGQPSAIVIPLYNTILGGVIY